MRWICRRWSDSPRALYLSPHQSHLFSPVTQVLAKAAEIQEAISEGANSFLMTEYRYMGVFCVIMSVFIFSLLSSIQPQVGGQAVQQVRRI